MSDQIKHDDFTVNKDNLYREVSITDLHIATIKILIRDMAFSFYFTTLDYNDLALLSPNKVYKPLPNNAKNRSLKSSGSGQHAFSPEFAKIVVCFGPGSTGPWAATRRRTMNALAKKIIPNLLSQQSLRQSL